MAANFRMAALKYLVSSYPETLMPDISGAYFLLSLLLFSAVQV